jgi:hypothetical protein
MKSPTSAKPAKTRFESLEGSGVKVVRSFRSLAPEGSIIAAMLKAKITALIIMSVMQVANRTFSFIEIAPFVSSIVVVDRK